MYRKDKYTASITNTAEVIVMYDDGWENILAEKRQFSSQADATAWLEGRGFQSYDPNASLKAAGMVFINGCYRMPG